jgi:hypothetical protein
MLNISNEGLRRAPTGLMRPVTVLLVGLISALGVVRWIRLPQLPPDTGDASHRNRASRGLLGRVREAHPLKKPGFFKSRPFKVLLTMIAVAVAVVVATVASWAASQQTIESSGPLTRIITGDDLTATCVSSGPT